MADGLLFEEPLDALFHPHDVGQHVVGWHVGVGQTAARWQHGGYVLHEISITTTSSSVGKLAGQVLIDDEYHIRRAGHESVNMHRHFVGGEHVRLFPAGSAGRTARQSGTAA